MKNVLTIAGSDCSGGAGIQADLKTFAAHGVYGMSAITSVVAENTLEVIGREDISPGLVAKQLEAIFEDIGADAVKVGMLPTASCMEAVAGMLREYQPANLVIDPVMIASSGGPLMESGAITTFILDILPLANLLTPNIPEAETIMGYAIQTTGDMERAAKDISQMGAKAVLIKGGHLQGDALDVLYDGAGFTHFSAERIHTRNTHGTGCTLSSAIAANLGLGYPLQEAVKRAKTYLTTALRHSLAIGKGHGPTHHFYELYQNGLTKGVKTDEL
jgi:hydroxymethylpyrimidine/phosphomethylpyrimidine kinase